MEKRFEVKRFLFETTRGGLLIYADRPPSSYVGANQYIEMKSANKLGTGRSHAYKLCEFFNFLHEKYYTEYDAATNK